MLTVGDSQVEVNSQGTNSLILKCSERPGSEQRSSRSREALVNSPLSKSDRLKSDPDLGSVLYWLRITAASPPSGWER